MFQFIWSSGFRGEHFQKSTNQKQELPVVAMFVNELCFSRFLTTDRYLGILRYLCLCILFVSIKSKLLKSKILYKECSFHPDPLTSMAATVNSCF
jgi:predicted ATPase